MRRIWNGTFVKESLSQKGSVARRPTRGGALSDRLGEPRRRVMLLAWQHVRVEIQRDRDSCDQSVVGQRVVERRRRKALHHFGEICVPFRVKAV